MVQSSVDSTCDDVQPIVCRGVWRTPLPPTPSTDFYVNPPAQLWLLDFSPIHEIGSIHSTPCPINLLIKFLENKESEIWTVVSFKSPNKVLSNEIKIKKDYISIKLSKIPWC